MPDKITKNPFLLFLPLIFVYGFFILSLSNSSIWGDESRHLAYAINMVHGFYSPPAPNISLELGPGYPLLLLPFVALHIPLLIARLLNALFTYLTVVFLFKTLRELIPSRIALLFTVFFACYVNILEFIALLYTESLTLFLVAAVSFLLVKTFRDSGDKINKKYIFWTGVCMGYLVLTKVIFGYVLVLMLSGSFVLWLIKRKNINYRKNFLVLLIAFAVCSPWLIYTYHITGRVLYWATSGGNNLYWMSTPYKGEYGNWATLTDYSKGKNDSSPAPGGYLNIENRDNLTPGAIDSIYKHHKDDFEILNKYNGLEKDEIFKKLMYKNIQSHPIKYIENCISNIGRLLFNYPYSYTYQKPSTLIRLPFNGLIVILMLFSIIPTCINWKKLAFSVRLLIIIIFLYLGGSILGSAETRMFTVLVPMILVWIAYILQHTVKLKLKFHQKDIS